MSSIENQERLVKVLNDISYSYAPDRGLTAEYIAMILDIRGVTAPVEPVLSETP
jgi:hypothetical protein